jgi:hypothetical protein
MQPRLRLPPNGCRLDPQAIRREFRGRESWQMFLAELEQLLDESHQESAPAPIRRPTPRRAGACTGSSASAIGFAS